MYVENLEAKTEEFARTYGFEVFARSSTNGTLSAAVGSGTIRLVLTETSAEEHRGAVYLRRHGEGVGDIALAVADTTAAFTETVRRGARPVAAPVEHDGVVTASVAAFGDVQHTFVQRRAGTPPDRLPGFVPTHTARVGARTGLLGIDHFAVCLESGQLQPTVDFYERVMGFSGIFNDRVVVGAQAMTSQVVRNPSGDTTFTLIEPDVTREPGQIDQFVKNHDGAGVQHIAFRTANIVHSVREMKLHGVGFLAAPPAYYRMLRDRLRPVRHSVDGFADLDILADEDHAGQLFQIFTRSTHPRGTLFFELVERAGARTFGNGNIRALYEAVEAERLG